MRAVWKILLTISLIGLLVPGLVVDFLAPDVLMVRWFWSLLELFLLIKLIFLIWPEKINLPRWFLCVLDADGDAVARHLPKLLILALWLDSLRLAFGLGFFGSTVGPSLELFNPTWWSLLLVTIFASLAGAGIQFSKKFFLLGLIGLLFHQGFLWLTKDIFAARCQVIIYLVLAVTSSGSWKLRAGLLLLGIALFWGESRFLATDLYNRTLRFPWPDPKNDILQVSFEVFMNQAAIIAGGRWGLGLHYWPLLDFLRAGPIPVNTIPLLVVWLGINGTGFYLIFQSLFLTVMVFSFQRQNSGWVMIPAWSILCLMTLNLLLSVMAPFGVMGFYDPIGLPFVGSGQVGLSVYLLTYFILGQRKHCRPAGNLGEEIEKK
ncbi:MAG: hypothetical protein LBP22_11170 [Deltaproteobacteria bacterium]|nr:hypothetical protein [Deltaproteobacteria bacterium]